ncbi:hypothetical protein [Pyramidobacter porci]
MGIGIVAMLTALTLFIASPGTSGDDGITENGGNRAIGVPAKPVILNRRAI